MHRGRPANVNGEAPPQAGQLYSAQGHHSDIGMHPRGLGPRYNPQTTHGADMFMSQGPSHTQAESGGNRRGGMPLYPAHLQNFAPIAHGPTTTFQEQGQQPRQRTQTIGVPPNGQYTQHPVVAHGPATIFQERGQHSQQPRQRTQTLLDDPNGQYTQHPIVAHGPASMFSERGQHPQQSRQRTQTLGAISNGQFTQHPNGQHHYHSASIEAYQQHERRPSGGTFPSFAPGQYLHQAQHIHQQHHDHVQYYPANRQRAPSNPAGTPVPSFVGSPQHGYVHHQQQALTYSPTPIEQPLPLEELPERLVNPYLQQPNDGTSIYHQPVPAANPYLQRLDSQPVPLPRIDTNIPPNTLLRIQESAAAPSTAARTQVDSDDEEEVFARVLEFSQREAAAREAATAAAAANNVGAPPRGQSEDDELAQVLALSQNEDAERQAQRDLLAKQEAEDLERALAESMQLSSNGFGFGVVSTTHFASGSGSTSSTAGFFFAGGPSEIATSSKTTLDSPIFTGPSQGGASTSAGGVGPSTRAGTPGMRKPTTDEAVSTLSVDPTATAPAEIAQAIQPTHPSARSEESTRPEYEVQPPSVHVKAPIALDTNLPDTPDEADDAWRSMLIASFSTVHIGHTSQSPSPSPSPSPPTNDPNRLRVEPPELERSASPTELAYYHDEPSPSPAATTFDHTNIAPPRSASPEPERVDHPRPLLPPPPPVAPSPPPPPPPTLPIAPSPLPPLPLALPIATSPLAHPPPDLRSPSPPPALPTPSPSPPPPPASPPPPMYSEQPPLHVALEASVATPVVIPPQTLTQSQTSEVGLTSQSTPISVVRRPTPSLPTGARPPSIFTTQAQPSIVSPRPVTSPPAPTSLSSSSLSSLTRISSSISLDAHQEEASPSTSAPETPIAGPMTPNQFIDKELLMGVSIGFKPPMLSARLQPMEAEIPNIISLPGGKGPPLHFHSPSWRNMLKLMARMSSTKLEPTVNAMANSKTELKLRTVIQFVKPSQTTTEWRTILWFKIDVPVPPNLPNAQRFQNNTTMLPFTFTLTTLPLLLKNAGDGPISKMYTVPSSESLPFPTLPITFSTLALYLQAVLDFSRESKDDAGIRKLAKMVDACYPKPKAGERDEGSMEAPDRRGVGDLFKRVIGRNKGKGKGKTNNADMYELITPFVPDEWG